MRFRDSESPAIQLRTLSSTQIVEHIEAFLAIAADVPGEYWTKENLLLDLPDKWRLSFAAWEGAQPVAYAILSRKGAGHVHLHHLMVAGDSRNDGVGALMVEEMERRATAAGCRCLTLKVAIKNGAAHKFYCRLGFRLVGTEAHYHAFEKSLQM